MGSRRCRILVVEDDADARSLLAEILQSEGYEVELAEDGLKALECLKGGAFGIVLTDVRMPGIEGLDLLREIRKSWPKLPVLLMTAFGDWEMYGEALREGAVDMIGKPFRRAELLKVLEHCLEGMNAGSPGPPAVPRG